MLETLIGTLLGGVFRMLPEVLKWLDRKDDRSHELSMFDKQLTADKMRADAQHKALQTQADTIVSAAELTALVAATNAQATRTNVKWVDAISSLMRPLITFWWVIVLYSTALVARFWVLVHAGTSNVDAIVMLWGADEKAIVASIISFWFVDRSLRK
jgi:hypothetical protein